MTEAMRADPATPEPSLPPCLRKPRLTRPEASEYLLLRHGLPVAIATLAKKASVGGGPPFHRSTYGVFYATADLDAWAAKTLGRAVASTAEPTEAPA